MGIFSEVPKGGYQVKEKGMGPGRAAWNLAMHPDRTLEPLYSDNQVRGIVATDISRRLGLPVILALAALGAAGYIVLTSPDIIQSIFGSNTLPPETISSRSAFLAGTHRSGGGCEVDYRMDSSGQYYPGVVNCAERNAEIAANNAKADEQAYYRAWNGANRGPLGIIGLPKGQIPTLNTPIEFRLRTPLGVKPYVTVQDPDNNGPKGERTEILCEDNDLNGPFDGFFWDILECEIPWYLIQENGTYVVTAQRPVSWTGSGGQTHTETRSEQEEFVVKSPDGKADLADPSKSASNTTDSDQNGPTFQAFIQNNTLVLDFSGVNETDRIKITVQERGKPSYSITTPLSGKKLIERDCHQEFNLSQIYGGDSVVIRACFLEGPCSTAPKGAEIK